MTDQLSNQQAKARIVTLGARLSCISRVSFRSRSGPGSQCGWSGSGEGSVTLDSRADIGVDVGMNVDMNVGINSSVRFIEKGYFRLDAADASPVAFSNVFRWALGSDYAALSYERRGAGVWLFDLVAAPASDHADLISREAHLCAADYYLACLTFVDAGFDLEWTINGPKKDEYLQYRYR